MNFKQTADGVRNLARMFGAVIELADAIDGLGSIEQLEGELKARAAKARADAEGAEAALGNLHQDIADAQGKLEQAKGTLEAEVAARAGLAAETISHAEATAADIIAKATAKSDSIAIEVANMSEMLNAVTALRDGVATELEELTSKLDRLKAQAAKLAGG